MAGVAKCGSRAYGVGSRTAPGPRTVRHFAIHVDKDVDGGLTAVCEKHLGENTMKVPTDDLSPSAAAPLDGLAPLCHDMFGTFARADQRRWGEIYVRGLITTPGRKSVRNICDHVVGKRADQCLQQFVNQSPWAHEPVRRALAQRLAQVIEPTAWVIREVVIPKNGTSSVGVARQFAQSAGRMINCQLGIVVFLAGSAGTCPVNWRLLLPRSWDADPVRRRTAHLPVEERYLARWQYMLDAIDEMTAEWGLDQVPILGDMVRESQFDAVLRGLEERQLPYVLELAADRPSLTVRSADAPPRSASLAEVMDEPSERGTITVTRAHAAAGVPGPQYQVKPLPARSRPANGSSAQKAERQRFVVSEWPRRRGPRRTWLTTLDGHRLSELPDKFAANERVNADMAVLNSTSGLQHFEGRSFRGWHHHVTLVSIAHGYQLLAGSAPRVSERALA